MKWWFPFYSYMLNVSVNNAWRLYMNTTGNKVLMMDFLRGVVVQLVSVHGSDKIPRVSSENPNNFDGKDHWLVFNPAPPGQNFLQENIIRGTVCSATNMAGKTTSQHCIVPSATWHYICLSVSRFVANLSLV